MARRVSRSLRPERYIYYHNDDGLTELCLGAAVLLAGLTVNDYTPLAALLWLIAAALAIMLLKRRITATRLEGSEIDPARVRRALADTRYATIRMATTAVTLGAAAILFLLYELLAGSESGLSSDLLQQPVFLVVVVISACFGAGTQYQAPRLYAYGALATILFVVSLCSGLLPRSILIVIGLVMVLVGAFFLVRFLRGHPRPGGR